MGARFAFVVLIAVGAFRLVDAVDKSKFKTCKYVSFCSRYRKYVKRITKSKEFVHELDSASISQDGHILRARIKHVNDTESFQALSLEVAFFQSLTNTCDVARITISEGPQALRPRFRPRDGDIVSMSEGLTPDPSAKIATVATADSTSTRFAGSALGGCVVELQHRPFEISVSRGDRLVQRFNAKHLLNFEQHRTKGVPKTSTSLVDATDVDEKDLWEEKFGEYVDSKPFGPAAVGIDIGFINASMVAGLPEHSAKLNLGSNDFSEPFRLYNLDVFHYEVDTPMALYGTVPMVTAVHRPPGAGAESLATAVFIVNPSEGFVKVQAPPDKTKGDENATADSSSWWVFESGVLDMFVFLGPSTEAVLQQYHSTTGWPRLPLLASLGKHQSRWNYVDVEDVKMVDSKFDEHRIPYDFIWLDLEHTNEKRYFTWDPKHFADAASMLDHMNMKKRKLVTIIDPHMKVDKNYTIYTRLKQADVLTRAPNGSVFEGFCWPGQSSYGDFCNPAARDEWAKLFDPSIYPHSRPYLYTWNDMNEPSVFNGPEVTMQKDNLHKCVGPNYTTEHRDMHNLYGFYFHEASVDGQLLRAPNVRPFVLTRSFFAGSHRHGPLWTGDNTASWSHLRRSVAMLLSLAMCGLSFAGADVPGFFGDPEVELYVRWHQLGVWYPFYRSHAFLTTKRREPWVYGPEVTALVRDAVVSRYELLPMWYTLFFEWASRGLPVIRPLWYSNLSDAESDNHADEHFFVGDALLVRAITKPKAEAINVYLPPGQWFDYWNPAEEPRAGGSVVQGLALHPSHIPVFARGGCIIAQKRRPRRSATTMIADPFTLVVYGSPAKGRLYVDDGESHDYKAGAFIYTEFTFDGVALTASIAPSGVVKSATNSTHASNSAQTSLPTLPKQGFRVERVVFVGLPKRPIGAQISRGSAIQKKEFYAEAGSSGNTWLVTLKEPGIFLDEPLDWTASFRF